MTTPVTTYREAARQFAAQAYAELEAGDLPQASEKGWGAAAQVVKAACEARGWEHGHHRLLFTAVKELANEAADPEIDILFASANYLHVNFYEDALDASTVQRHLGRTEEFIVKIEGILDG